ncbi:MAG TPA: hypothetical protein VGO47_05470, partial [Chlamydiales bacterium]|nr:hypothetical protein [Chlamydiales bacterium]
GVIDLDLLDPAFDSNQVFNERWDTPSIAIVIVTRELAYSKCSDQHPWLGPHLLRLVETTLRLRRLSKQEMSVIWELAERRKE